MKAWFIVLWARIKAVFTWENIKTWPRRFFNWFCKFLRGAYAFEIFCGILTLLYTFQVSKFFGVIFFFMAVWFTIQRINERG
jgi:hypothetical protein